MSLIRTMHPMLALQQINRMFDFDTDLFGRLEELGDGLYAPAVDVKEDDTAYIVHLEVPGVTQDKLSLSLQENVLTIKGVKEQQPSEGRYRRIERSYGAFVRSLSLPRNVDENGVTADLHDGVLEVRLPKREEARPRQISVGTTHNASSASSTVSSSIDEPASAAEPPAAPPQAPQQNEPAPGENAVGENSESAPEGNPS